MKSKEWLKVIPAFGELMLSSAKAVKDTLARAFYRARFGKSWAQVSGSHQRPRYQFNSTTLEEAKARSGSVLIHALTVKGKGYEPAERDKAAWHGTSAFEIATGKFIKEPATAPLTLPCSPKPRST